MKKLPINRKAVCIWLLARGGLLFFGLAACAGCQDKASLPPAAQSGESWSSAGAAKTFAEHWQQLIVELADFRETTRAMSPEAAQLAKLRDRIRQHLDQMKSTAVADGERQFIQTTASGLAEFLRELDQAVQYAHEGDVTQTNAAARRAIFILEEIDGLLQEVAL